MPILTVNHVTTYAYSRPVGLGEHRMMLRPRDSYDQRLLSATLDIDPLPLRLTWLHDVFDNCVTLATFTGQTRRLRFESNITLDHTPFNGPEFLLEERARFYPFSYSAEEMPDLARSVERHYLDPSSELDRWVRRFIHQGRPTETGALLMTLTYAIKEGFSYERRTEGGAQTPLQTLERRRGSCRDFAVLMMEAARTLGLAARFVSGYIYVPQRDSGASYLGGGSTHAWCQVYLPGAGWSRVGHDQRDCRQPRSRSGWPSRVMRAKPFHCPARFSKPPRTKGGMVGLGQCPSPRGQGTLQRLQARYSGVSLAALARGGRLSCLAPRWSLAA